jgi:hypothetical protein
MKHLGMIYNRNKEGKQLCTKRVSNNSNKKILDTYNKRELLIRLEDPYKQGT